MFVRQIIFLVGGKGTRLGNVTANTPKPLLEIGRNIRFLDVLLNEAARHGFTDIILLAGHLGEQVAQLYDGRWIGASRVRVIVEPSPAGTGGALLYAKDTLDPWFVVCNGDSLFQVNLRAIAQLPEPGFKGKIALRKVVDPSRFGTVTLEGVSITSFYEKDPNTIGPALINAGIYLLSRDVVSKIATPSSIEQDVFPDLATKGALQGIELSGYFLDIGLPDTYATACRDILQRFNRPAVFFDRDGVLNVDTGYTHDPAKLVWIEGAREAVRLVNDAGWLALVVTNQAGIARGLFSVADMHSFHNQMQIELADVGAHIDEFFYCPFHKDGIIADFTQDDHPDRKPNPGMISTAIEGWQVRVDGSFLVGDQDHDLIAASRAGIKGIKYHAGSLSTFIKPYLTSEH